jgi:hypothetical protein
MIKTLLATPSINQRSSTDRKVHPYDQGVAPKVKLSQGDRLSNSDQRSAWNITSPEGDVVLFLNGLR